jgi:hypothetical protein
VFSYAWNGVVVDVFLNALPDSINSSVEFLNVHGKLKLNMENVERHLEALVLYSVTLALA